MRNDGVFHPIRVGGSRSAVGLEVVHLDHLARQVIPLDVEPMRRLEAQRQRVGLAHGRSRPQEDPQAKASQRRHVVEVVGPAGRLKGEHPGENPHPSAQGKRRKGDSPAGIRPISRDRLHHRKGQAPNPLKQRGLFSGCSKALVKLTNQQIVD